MPSFYAVCPKAVPHPHCRWESKWRSFFAAKAGRNRGTAVTGNSPPAPETLRVRSESRRSEEHTSELQSLMRISYAVFCLNKQKNHELTSTRTHNKHLNTH